MTIRFLLLLAILCTARVSAARADDPGAVTDAALLARLEGLDARFAEITRLRANFRQERQTPMLRRPLTSSGSVLLKDGVIRWNTREPSRSTMLITEDEIRIHDPEARVLEIYQTRERAGTAAEGRTGPPRLKDLLAHFSVMEVGVDALGEKPSERWLGLELIPTDEEMARRIVRITALLDTEAPMIRRVILEGVDGEVTDLELRDVRIGARIEDHEMELEIPEGTRISRPPGSQPESGDDATPDKQS